MIVLLLLGTAIGWAYGAFLSETRRTAASDVLRRRTSITAARSNGIRDSKVSSVELKVGSSESSMQHNFPNTTAKSIANGFARPAKRKFNTTDLDSTFPEVSTMSNSPFGTAKDCRPLTAEEFLAYYSKIAIVIRHLSAHLITVGAMAMTPAPLSTPRVRLDYAPEIFAGINTPMVPVLSARAILRLWARRASAGIARLADRVDGALFGAPPQAVRRVADKLRAAEQRLCEDFDAMFFRVGKPEYESALAKYDAWVDTQMAVANAPTARAIYVFHVSVERDAMIRVRVAPLPALDAAGCPLAFFAGQARLFELHAASNAPLPTRFRQFAHVIDTSVLAAMRNAARPARHDGATLNTLVAVVLLRQHVSDAIAQIDAAVALLAAATDLNPQGHDAEREATRQATLALRKRVDALTRRYAANLDGGAALVERLSAVAQHVTYSASAPFSVRLFDPQIIRSHFAASS